MKRPKVSVIVPVYNVEKYLKCCVDSLLHQTLTDIEIILVNDESQDHCPAICDEFAKKDHRVKVIHKKHEGCGYSRNSGIEMATGEYITFVDSDDYVELNTYEQLYNRATGTKADIVYFMFRRFIQIGHTWMETATYEERLYHSKEDIRGLMLNMIATKPEAESKIIKCSSCCALYRHDILKRHGLKFKSEKDYISEDLLFNLDYLLHSSNVITIPDVFYNYRVNMSSMTRTVRSDKIIRVHLFYKHLLEVLSANNFGTEGYLRATKWFIGLSKGSIRQYVQSSLSKREKMRWLRKVVNYSFWQEIASSYPYKKLPWKQALLFYLLHKRYVHLLYYIHLYIIKSKEKNMKILVNCPNINRIGGGVANHYLGLKPYWKENIIYNYVGGGRKFYGVFAFIGKIRTLFYIIKFIVKLLYYKPDVVLINISLGRKGMSSRLILLRIANCLERKTVLFIHGWRVDYEKDFFSSKRFESLKKADGIIVLANEFKQKLIQNGYQGTIFLTTTKVDDRLIENFDINKRTGKIENILFLARVEKPKGIFETIKTYEILKIKYNYLKLRVVGFGTALQEAKEYVKNHKIIDVTFMGNLSGEKLLQEFYIADIYLLPTYHGEGMPTSLLEAMAFGLPVISRPVGGIKDFFDDKMGFITESTEPKVYADAIEQYINDCEKTLTTSRYNHEYAKKHFMASNVALSMEKILREIYNS